MKNYQEFMDYVKENVADYLPEKFEQAEITVHQMVKNNDVMLDGLNIHDPDRNLSPNIYLNPLYEQYENGRDLDEIVSRYLCGKYGIGTHKKFSAQCRRYQKL